MLIIIIILEYLKAIFQFIIILLLFSKTSTHLRFHIKYDEPVIQVFVILNR